jgi:hypothetical protein
MTTIIVKTKIENITCEGGIVNQKIVKYFPLKELPFALTKEVEGNFNFEKSEVNLPNWANFSDKDYLYSVRLTDENLCIHAATPGLINKAAGKVFKKFIDSETYLTRKDLGEKFTFRKRKKEEEEFDLSPGGLFPNEEDY